uniref:Uncharacterized protein n=1 Tax=Arundo donax TaxID=35708 RepID=A0A0A9Q1Q2_ARUDO
MKQYFRLQAERLVSWLIYNGCPGLFLMLGFKYFYFRPKFVYCPI